MNDIINDQPKSSERLHFKNAIFGEGVTARRNIRLIVAPRALQSIEQEYPEVVSLTSGMSAPRNTQPAYSNTEPVIAATPFPQSPEVTQYAAAALSETGSLDTMTIAQLEQQFQEPAIAYYDQPVQTEQQITQSVPLAVTPFDRVAQERMEREARQALEDLHGTDTPPTTFQTFTDQYTRQPEYGTSMPITPAVEPLESIGYYPQTNPDLDLARS